ncbi:MAG: Calx-beta domain-containing protein, partial [Candidatus Nitrosotenuis sp.]
MEKAWPAFLKIIAIVILAVQVSNSAALPTNEVTIHNVITCQSVQGTWVDPFCIIDQIPLTISSGQKLTIASNVQLLIQKAMSNAGTVDNYGVITNSQSITNSGTFNNFHTVSNSRHFDNFGTINNHSIFVNSGRLTNTGIINNHRDFQNSDTIDNTIGLIRNICAGIIIDPNGDPNLPPGIILGNLPVMISCPPNLFIFDVQDEEGDTGSTVFNFLISLNAPAPLDGVQVSFSTSDGSATTSDADYQTSSGLIIIPEGQTSGNIQIEVNSDTKIEPDEFFLVNLSNVVNAIISDGQGIGTIQNDDVDSDGDGILD